MQGRRVNLLQRDDRECFFRGSLQVLGRNGGVVLQRVTERQGAYYRERSPAWDIRARCNAGQEIVVRTDSAFLDLDAKITAAARPYLGFDVAVDGRPVRTVRIPEAKNPVSLRLFEADSGPRRLRTVRVMLPNAVALRFNGVLAEDGSTVEPVPSLSRRLLCLGDSITQGMCAVSPASTLAVQLALHAEAELLNQAVGGHVFDPDSLDPDLPYRPDLVTVAYGTNDWSAGTTREAVTDAVRAYLAALQSMVGAGVPILVIGPLWRTDADRVLPGGNLREFSDVILKVAREEAGCVTADGFGLVPTDPEYLPDGIHPNELGFMHYVAGLLRTEFGRQLTTARRSS